MISINNLSKSFRKNKALNNFSFDFNNKIYGLLGPNGSGKTTLLRCITNLYRYNGSIEIDDMKNGEQKLNPNSIGYLSQNFGLFPQLTVNEMLTYFSLGKDIPKNKISDEISACLKAVGLEDKAADKISSLSGGMVRRIGIAQAFLGAPELIIFDEPTTGLDPEERLRFKNTVLQQKTERNTVILSTHIVTDVADICDEIIIMNKGIILLAAPADEIAAIAEGKVFLIPKEKRYTIKDDAYVVGQEKNDGADYIRIIAACAENGIPAQPSLEDGYICCIKNI